MVVRVLYPSQVALGYFQKAANSTDPAIQAEASKAADELKPMLDEANARLEAVKREHGTAKVIEARAKEMRRKGQREEGQGNMPAAAAKANRGVAGEAWIDAASGAEASQDELHRAQLHQKIAESAARARAEGRDVEVPDLL